jgi:hypothetical protein
MPPESAATDKDFVIFFEDLGSAERPHFKSEHTFAFNTHTLSANSGRKDRVEPSFF